jgi:hypothetical protein
MTVDVIWTQLYQNLFLCIISNRFAALEDLDAEVEIYTVWETERL